MTTATRPNNLETLEHLLHEGFQSDLLPFVPVQVQCRLKDEMLVVLAQHPATTVPDSQQVFSSIERTIQEQQWSDSHSVKIYLRVEGQKSPYAFYSFKIERPVSATTTTTPVEETLDTPDLSDSLPEEATDSHEVETETSQSSEVPPFESTSPHRSERAHV